MAALMNQKRLHGMLGFGVNQTFAGARNSALAAPLCHGWHEICREQVDLSRPENQLNYTHEVRVHDVGKYQFKGITTDFSIKSINLAAFEGRNAGYVCGMKSGKAKQVAEGRGYERVRLCNAMQLSAAKSCQYERARVICRVHLLVCRLRLCCWNGCIGRVTYKKTNRPPPAIPS